MFPKKPIACVTVVAPAVPRVLSAKNPTWLLIVDPAPPVLGAA